MSGSRASATASEAKDSEGESLMEVLENINEGKTELNRLSRKPSPLLSPDTHDPDRITDYPRAQSPPGSRSPMDRSRRSSLSAMSESSLNSDHSSMSYDASKMPAKKILKNPHRKKKHTTNRVRWKDEESDTASMKSFDTLSTTSEVVYNRARNGVMEVRQNWKDLESIPSRNIGITPSRGRGMRNHLVYHSGIPTHSHSSSSLLNSSLSTSPTGPVSQYLLGGSPGSRTGSHQRSGSTSSLPLIPANKEMINFTGNPSASRPFQHSPSPLTGLAIISPSSGVSQQANFQSTPKPRNQSDSMLLDSALRRTTENSRDQSASSPSFDIDLPYPVLKLDNSNLTDLEESTMEDRKKMHIFKFPQNSPVAKSPPSYACQFFLADDDEGDYDHLSPIDAPKDDEEFSVSVQPEDKQKDEQKDSPEGENEKKDENAYSDQDIEDALGELENISVNSSSSSTHEPPAILPTKNASQEEDEIVKEADASLSMLEEPKHLDWHFSQVSSSPCGSQEIPEETLASTNQQAPSTAFKEERTVTSVVTSLESAKERRGSTTLPANDQVPVDRRKAGFSGVEVQTKSTNGIEARGQGSDMPLKKPKPPPVAPKPIRKGPGRTGEVLKGSNVTTTATPVPQTSSITKASAQGEEQEMPSNSQNQLLNLASPVPPSNQNNHRISSSNEEGTCKDKTPLSNHAEIKLLLKDDTKSSEESQPSQEISSQDQEQPPPLPPKTKRIRRQDRDIDGQPLPPPMLDTSSSQSDKRHSLVPADVEDILPPPPEFAFPSPSKSQNSDDVFIDQTQQDTLESASNSTLVPDHENGPGVRQTLDIDQVCEREALSSSSSSSSLSHRSNKHSWSVIHYNKTKERSASRSSGSLSPPGSSVGGSSQEDNEGRWINRSRIQENSSSAGGNRLSTNPSSSSAKSSSIYVPRLTRRTTETQATEGRLPNSYPHHSSQRKHNRQYERHFSDRGPNLGQHQEPFTNGATKQNPDSNSSHLNSHSKHRHQSFEQNSRESERAMQLRKVPNRHAPPPPVPPHITAKLSEEERQLLHLTYLGKPRMMKPVVHDTEKHIQEMLAEIDSENTRRQPAYGTFLA